MSLFQHYVIVDWSAANQKKTGRDSIWICHLGPHGERCENPETRHRAKLLLAEVLAIVIARGERAVLGFDFPFGYPAGFAARLGLNGALPWRAVWDEIARLIDDGEDNRSNRFEVGAAFNQRVSNGSFPFWGCPVGFAHDHLGPKHHNGHAADGLAEKRLIDRWMVGAQPCWKLAYTGSVGSQVLTGLPVVRALRDDPRWADSARVWPFETGLGLSEDARIVFAEVWPSWWKARAELGPPNDRAQVRTVAEIFAAADRAGELAAWFAGDPALTDSQRRLAETEEAWTLGVTVPRVPKTRLVGWKSAAHSVTPSDTEPVRRITPRSSALWSDATMRPERHSGAAQRAEPGSDAHRPRQQALSSDDRVPGSPARGYAAPRDDEPLQSYNYLREPAAIYRRSFALIRQEADLARFPKPLRPLAIRLAHAAGDIAILDDLGWSRGAVAAGGKALAAGAPILVDSAMVMAGIVRDRLPARNSLVCTLNETAVPALAAKLKTTRSAAAVELWRPHLAGAVVAIGNAPTALFRLLEILAKGAETPALVLGFPVGFVGAAEAKEALIGFGPGLPYIALRGRRGGSALAAAAVNALAIRDRG
jgi:precorrin-8X/cobalt-precorrin-8 methylmutase